MDALWPWLAVAASGALHGLNPLCGWLPAAACGARALWPIVVGHAASIAVVVAMVAIAPGMDRRPMLVAAGALLCLLVALRRRARACTALSAFIAGALHGSGLMLVPALLPLCVGNGAAARIAASGSLALALAALALHLGAMLAVTALLARAGATGIRLARRWAAAVAHRAARTRDPHDQPTAPRGFAAALPRRDRADQGLRDLLARPAGAGHQLEPGRSPRARL